ncbi:FHA domain-containing protein, partial [Klebsiella pneumoniae]|nr:FHA domain-containing protein [Klebsiella pneumoniae]
GILRVSSGATAVLDADVIIGRVPQGTSSTSAQSPRLLAVPSPGKAISKTHCAVRVEGWDMSVEDLGSTNGTFLLRAGE